MSNSDDRPVDESSVAPRFGPPTTANPLWRMVVVAGAAFVLSCLLWITSGIGSPDAPMKQWLNRHGMVLVLITGSASIVAAISAMVLDSVQTSRMGTDPNEDPRVSGSVGDESAS